MKLPAHAARARYRRAPRPRLSPSVSRGPRSRRMHPRSTLTSSPRPSPDRHHTGDWHPRVCLGQEVCAGNGLGLRRLGSDSHTFDDRTTRRTIATHTIPGPGGAQEIKITKDTKACEEFKVLSKPFRESIDSAVRRFGERLSGLLHTETPMLATRAGFPFETFAHVVDNGEHLEHFHAYTKEERLEGEDTSTGKGSVAAVAAAANDDGTTLPMHTDQGLFIAFTPALVVRRDGAVGGDDSTFLVRLSDGTVESVSFDADSLVFMIGHGVEQVVRPKLLPGGLMPRATHAVTVIAPRDDPSAQRAWYGRMVLPPHDAAVAGAGVTYGEMRATMNAEVKSPASSSSSSSSPCGRPRLLFWRRCCRRLWPGRASPACTL